MLLDAATPAPRAGVVEPLCMPEEPDVTGLELEMEPDPPPLLTTVDGIVAEPLD
jgi:hypothetical protein